MNNDNFYVFCDGSCYNEPGKNTAGWAAVITKENPLEKEHIIEVKKGWFENGTNNQAEWQALIGGLFLVGKYSTFFPDAKFTMISDSELIINQAKGVYRVRNEELQKLHRQFQRVMRVLKRQGVVISFKWVRRQENKVADYLSKRVNPYYKNKKLERARR